MLETWRKCWRFELTSEKLENEIFDLNDPDVVNELKIRNFSYLYRYYLNLNNKEEALNILLERENGFFNQAVTKEIVHCYLYFNDFKGALEYIEKAKLKVPDVRAYEFLIKIHLLEKNKGCEDEEFFNLIKEGLSTIYDRRFIEVTIEFYKANCKECLNRCLKEKLTVLQDIIKTFHYADLKYVDAKYLYYVMPNKGIFLKKMVQKNPKIKRKFYLEYAKIYGFNREEISKILQAKFRTWAFEIALFFGWIEEKHRHSFEKYLAPYPTTINRNGRWDVKDKKIFSFNDEV